jgi:hypothetical protein
MSPFAGIVVLTVLKLLSAVRNGVVAAAGAADVLAADVVAEVDELDGLLLLLLPHPDSASVASGTAKIIFLLTGFVLSFGEPRE